MHIFYQPSLTPGDLLLPEEESKHCIRVLRMKRGDTIVVINGKGMSCIATIIDDNPKRCIVHTNEIISHPTQQTYYLHIAIASTKNFDRMEWFIEKAVEIGISEITFMQCENSERTKINTDRCHKIAVSALKQSKQWHLPVINGPVAYKDVILTPSTDSLRLIAYCETNPSAKLSEVLTGVHESGTEKNSRNKITILIGPEGDFTIEEIDLAMKAGFKTVSLGANRLRTETAALLCVSAVQMLR